MTEAGADSRANYLLKWEAIRSSREQGATTYDLWGLAHAGIAHFKTGFGGREIALRRGVGPRARRARAADVLGRPDGARPRGAAAPRRCGRRRRARRATAAGPATRATAGRRVTGGAVELDGRGARGLGRRAPSTRPAGTSCSRGRGRSTARRGAGSRRFLALGEARALALVRPWPGVGGGSAYLPRGPVGDGRPWTRRRERRARSATALAAASPRTSRTAASTWSPRTRRSPPATRATRGRSPTPGSTRSTRSSRRAIGWRSPLPADGDAEAVLADVAKATRQRIRRAERDGVAVLRWDAARGRRRARGPRDARPRRPRPPWAGSSASCAPPASGAASGSPVPRSSSPGGCARWPPATSSTSRRARAPRTATCWAASSCTATGGACRRPTPRTGRSAATTTRARCTCCAGGRSSSRSRRAGPRWTSAGSTSPAPAASRRRASRPTACTSTSGRSGRPGSRWPAPRSTSPAPWRYAAGRAIARARTRAWAGGAAGDRARRRTEPGAADRPPARRRGAGRAARARRAHRPAAAPPTSSAARVATTCRSAPRRCATSRSAGVDRRLARGPARARCSSPCPASTSTATTTSARAAAAGAAAAIVEHPVAGTRPAAARRRPPRGPRSPRRRRWWYGDPSRTLGIVGITGTDGKTTTSFLAVAALEAAGLSTGLIGTVETKVGAVRDRHAAHVTTPGAPELQATLAAMARAGNAAAVVETTSHALALDRVLGVAWDAARVHQPDPRAPRAPRHVRGVPRGQAAAVPGARRRHGRPTTRRKTVAGPAVAQGRRSSTATTPRRRGSRPPPTRPAPRSSPTARTPAATSGRRRVEEDARRLRVAYAAPSGARRARAPAGRPLQRPQRAGGRRAGRGPRARPGRGPRGPRVGRGRPGPHGADRRGPAVRGDRRLRALAGVAARPSSTSWRRWPPRAAAGSSRCSGRRASATRPSGRSMGRIAAERCRLVVATDEDPARRGPRRDRATRSCAARRRRGGRRGVDVLAIPDRREAIAAAFERAAPGRRRPARRARATRRRSCTRTARSRGTRPPSRARRSRRWATGGAEACAAACSRCSSARSSIALFVLFGLPAIAGGRAHRRRHGRGPPVGRHGRHREQRPADGPPRPPRRPGPRPRDRRHVPRPRDRRAST